MPIEVLMPALSPTMTEGNLTKWLKKEGDDIKAGEVMAEIETDKATMEVEAVDEGILGKILIPEGSENVAVNELIALILEEDEDKSALDGYVSESDGSAAAGAANGGAPETGDAVPATGASSSPAPATGASSGISAAQNEGRVFATPLARRIADQKGLQLNTIHGSGPNGRIIKMDVENANASPQNFAPAPTHNGPLFEDVKLNNMRKVIAQRLTESKQTVPHFYLTVDCELDKLLKARAELNTAQDDVKLSVNDFIAKACAKALIKVPEANATWHDTFVRLYKTADICVAVAVDGGLVTPIVKNADTKSILTISKEIKSLAERARDNALKPEEYQGGNFTLSNLGMFGVKSFDAILNPPQSCILAVGKGEQRMVVKDNQPTVATVMTVTLSVDHRSVDGAVGARFLAAFKGFIENPITMMV